MVRGNERDVIVVLIQARGGRVGGCRPVVVAKGEEEMVVEEMEVAAKGAEEMVVVE